MDSVTQMVFGAAVSGAVMGRRHGVAAFVWGGVVGTLPDLDSFVSYGSPVADFTYHRGYTHALLVQTLAAPLIALAINRWHSGGRAGYPDWLLAVWLVLVSHALLDAFTVYGTQLLLPFSDYPVGLGSVFIIDPLYTLPLLAGVTAALVWRHRPARAARWNHVGLLLGCAYLGWSVAAQQVVAARAGETLAEKGVEVERMLATPTPFNTVLWRVVAMTPDGYLEGFHRIGQQRPTEFFRYDSAPELLNGIEDAWPVRRLRDFTKGFSAVEQRDGAVVISDLRMGIEPYYVFAFEVGRLDGGSAVALEPERALPRGRPPIGRTLGDLLRCGRGEPTRIIRC